jgi:EAL domain-containing protein (putative c-di-GMP-specific phosphodiesterase class I)
MRASGLAPSLAALVLRVSCAAARGWTRRAREPVRLRVNLGVAELAQPGLVDLVIASLAETGLAPSDLVVEVAADVVGPRAMAAGRACARLVDLGVVLSLDGYGTHARDLPRIALPGAEIKLARPLVADVGRDGEAAPVIAEIVALAGALGRRVAVGGVESFEQLRWLVRSRVALVQGFALGRPSAAATLDLAELERLAARQLAGSASGWVAPG